MGGVIVGGVEVEAAAVEGGGNGCGGGGRSGMAAPPREAVYTRGEVTQKKMHDFLPR